MSEHFEPAGGCTCASCLARRGSMEQAEVWQARAQAAEARVSELEAVIFRAIAHLAAGQPQRLRQILEDADHA